MRLVLLERPSFWPDPRSPEAWLHALEVLEQKLPTADWPPACSPRTVGERCLPGLSRRSVSGLFGPDLSRDPIRLYGIGLLEQRSSRWELSKEGRTILDVWRTGVIQASLEALALQLLRRSVWLRLLLIRLHRYEWRLEDWPRWRRGDGSLAPGHGLALGGLEQPGAWTQGITAGCLGAWADALADADLELRPHIVQTSKSSDGFSWAPLKGPLYLLDSLGWMDEQGRLTLPLGLASQVGLPLPDRGPGVPLPPSAAWLTEISLALADFRGYVAVEPAMRALAQRSGLEPTFARHPEAFPGWMDELLEGALRIGAIELHAAEPGQARHGRGLFGDRTHQRVRWSIHPEFDALFIRQQNELESVRKIHDNPDGKHLNGVVPVLSGDAR